MCSTKRSTYSAKIKSTYSTNPVMMGLFLDSTSNKQRVLFKTQHSDLETKKGGKSFLCVTLRLDLKHIPLKFH